MMLQELRSGLLRRVAGEAGFDLGMIPDGLTDGGIQRAPILSAIDGQWSTFDAARKERMIGWLAEALSRQLGKTNPPTDGEVERGTAIINRSEEHTSELQSRRDLVCRLLLEKKK